MTEEEKRADIDEDRRQNARNARSPSPDDKLKDATTLYCGNLSFYTTEEQIHELFSKCVFPSPSSLPPCLSSLCIGKDRTNANIENEDAAKSNV